MKMWILNFKYGLITVLRMHVTMSDTKRFEATRRVERLSNSSQMRKRYATKIAPKKRPARQYNHDGSSIRGFR